MMSYVAMMCATFLEGGRESLGLLCELHCLAERLSVYIRGADHPVPSEFLIKQTNHLSSIHLSQWVSFTTTTTTKTPLTTAAPRAVLLALAVPAVLTVVLKAVLTAALEAPGVLAVLNTSVALKAVLTAVPAALVALAVLAALTVVLTAALEALEALVVPAALTVTVALKAVPADAGKYDLTYLRPPFHRASPGVEACLDCTYVVGFDCG
ncbi:uncharacterized protein BO95DRAFT_42860 [Aspergillus brunneoviolaceus CBS 621.78]|uniref:Uncharacterized protein n=1 Tax=Aspergillus brunneoviolaceus CBS 621.78 TaxID=1450534 RepID=A0ACD1GHF6_9EURO|nr:hypothetical protein BO95DRAFT_42860 [Aspergillus brunneoviolaceus CBS 621.78]RAH48595.1 hypothetical protein BO95DRAFT_42860 [Aspergillus brunneoviolaceus CBS 621.78]